MIVRALTPQEIRDNLAHYLGIHADVSPWTAENLLQELPEKWSLSFSMVHDKVPVAYCIMSKRDGLTHIHQFMVGPSWRYQGIGATMLQEAMRRGAQALKVDPKNEGAIRFYSRHGFLPAGTEDRYLRMQAA